MLPSFFVRPVQQMERRSLETRCRLLQDLYSPINSLTKSAGGAQEGRVKIPPLVAAAFSGNWILFREIYDSYEKWTKQRWTRKNVRGQLECFNLACILHLKSPWSCSAIMLQTRTTIAGKYN